jgi:hypothetical protein
VTPYHYNGPFVQPGSPLAPILLLAAAILVVLALAMSGVSRSAMDWPAGPLPTPEPAPDIAPTVALSIHLS